MRVLYTTHSISISIPFYPTSDLSSALVHRRPQLVHVRRRSVTAGGGSAHDQRAENIKGDASRQTAHFVVLSPASNSYPSTKKLLSLAAPSVRRLPLLRDTPALIVAWCITNATLSDPQPLHFSPPGLSLVSIFTSLYLSLSRSLCAASSSVRRL